MKGFKFLIALMCMTGIVSCGMPSCEKNDDSENPAGNSTWDGIKAPDDANVTGTVSGDFDISNPRPGSTATVTLSGFPGSLKSFQNLQAQIGGDPVGAAVLPLVGMEVYYQRGSRIGLECIKSACWESAVDSYLELRLREMYNSSDPRYFRPYQVAAFLKGASPENGYNPTKPYTFELTYKDQEEDQMVLGATIYTFRLKYSGSEVSKDVKIQVFRPNGQSYFVVSSWSSCYVYVKQIASGQTFNGLD